MSARMAEAIDTSAEDAIEKLRDTRPGRDGTADDDDMPLPTEPRTIFLGGSVSVGRAGSALCCSPDRTPSGAGVRIETAAAAGGPAPGSSRRAARIRCACRHPYAGVGSCRDHQRCRRAGGVVGRQAAGRHSANPATTCISCPTDQLVSVDDGATTRCWRHGRQRAAGVVRTLRQCNGDAVQRHDDGGCRPVHDADRPVLLAGLGRDIPAPPG